jgi:hypothetical protein
MYLSMSPMTLLIVFGAIGSGWAMLSVLSGERSRKVRQIEAEAEAKPAEPVPPSIPIASSPAPQPKKPVPKPASPVPAKAK